MPSPTKMAKIPIAVKIFLFIFRVFFFAKINSFLAKNFYYKKYNFLRAVLSIILD